MAVLAMQKIKLAGYAKDKQKILDTLQREGAMEVTELIEEENDNAKIEVENSSDKAKRERTHAVELDIANIEFAIKLLTPFAKIRTIFQGPIQLTPSDLNEKVESFNFEKLIDQCRAIEETIVALKNEYTSLESLQSELEPWRNLYSTLKDLGETKSMVAKVGIIQTPQFAEFTNDLAKISKISEVQKIHEDPGNTYMLIIYSKDKSKEVKELISLSKIQEPELPSESHDVKKEISNIKDRKKQINKELNDQDEELKVLAKQFDDLQIVHDYFVWKRDKMYVEGKAENTEYAFAMEGWIPIRFLERVKKEITKLTSNFEIIEIELKEGEKEPVAIKNNVIFTPFESVTNIYGLPLANEMDPTPFLSAFFIIFFGLCLTDAGYGMLLFIMCFAALKWMKLPEGSTKLVKLLMVGGIVTFILGALFGGWFGMTPDQAPGFLTYLSNEGVREFKWQIINPTKGDGPLIFLILAAILGYVQVLFGLILDGYWKIKHGRYLDAAFDSGLWFYFLVIMMLFGLSKTGVFLEEYSSVITLLVWLGVAGLILTQGRKQKNIILKFLSGVLSLYGLVGYFADVLSYSRLMALGLGTGIIGFAFNTIAGLVGNIPIVGIVFAIIVILIGHSLNIAISTLGAFIHSSRLQFVEFFGKFMEGGGKDFRPLKRESKYILIKEEK